MNLATLYRRYTRDGARSTPQADAVLALSDDHGQASTPMLDALGNSGVHADLLHFSRDLQPESIALSAQLAALLLDSPATSTHSRSRAAHLRHAPRSAATHNESWRRSSLMGLAAILVAGVVFWTAQHRAVPTSISTQSASVRSADLHDTVPDRIFAALDTAEGKSGHGANDVIFRADFRSTDVHGDEIFKAKFSGG
jgi:hypothetical protein